MTYAATLPRSDAALDSAGNSASREYFRFFSDLSRVNAANGELPARVDALDVRVRTLEERPAGATGRLIGPQSVRVDGLLSTGIATVHLAGDVNQPAALSFYGALTLGGRGWQNLAPESFEARDNGDGTLTLDLVDLANSGAGTLLGIERDAKGRLSGTRAVTTTDLAEGDNLYFTDARAAAAAPIQSLVAGANVTIDVTDPRNPIISSIGGGGGGGDVFGPSSATNGAVALFSGTTGKLLKNGVVLGSAATTAASDYATAAQGAKADSALQDASAFASAAQGAVADTAVQSVVAGSGVTVDATDPQHPIVSATGGGAGAVDSVNGQTGAVVLGAADVGAATQAQGAAAETAIQAVIAGANVTVNNTDPLRPVVSATGGGGGITVHFPFFLADGSASNVALTADQMLPFFLADGSASDIALTT